MKRILFVFALLALAAGPVLAQHGSMGKDSMGKMPPPGMRVTKAVCVLYEVGDSKVSGVVTFTQTDEGMRVEADIEGLTPGDHGFHIHQYGDCSAPDGTSAGGHFNPGNEPHAGPDATQRHVGDLGNITADKDGHAHYSRVDHHLAFHGPAGIIGRGIIVHAAADDLKSQPTGAAGARVACGVIGVANDK